MSADMLCHSERIAAMPCASWRSRSSQSFALPASSGYCRWNASKSGSPPSMRSFSARLRSRIISRALELLGREVLERVAHVLEVGAEHLLLQLLEQLLVLLRCLRLHEFIVLERAHRAAEVLGQRVELREPILRELLHRLSHLLVRRLGGAPALETLTLEALHLIELLLELVEHLREIVALRAALLGRAEPLEQVLHAVHATGDAPTRQARERVLEIAASEQLVGHRAQELLRFERVEPLGPVPAPVADPFAEVVEARYVTHTWGVLG